LENTDHRPRKNNKVKGDSNSEKPNDHNESDEINETIVHFEINNDFEIIVDSSKNDNDKETTVNIDSSENDDKETTLNNRWSLDISNVCKNGNKYFIFVAVSKIDDDDMKKCTIKGKVTRTAIYQIKLKIGEKGNYVLKDTGIITYHIYGISGLCRFVEVSKNNDKIEISNSKIENDDYYTSLRRFIILNFDGIHSFNCKDNFNLSKKLNYPKCVRNELDLSGTSDCTDLLHSSIYDRYFLVEHYKDNIQLLEGINKILKIIFLSLYIINRLITVYFDFFFY
jgi:hypothetical protein